MRKYIWIAPFVLTTALLSPTLARATDECLIAAALPDEASECRYLEKLAQDTRYMMAHTRKERFGQAHTRQELDDQIAQDMQLLKNFNEAITVIRAKHAQMPTCFAGFADVYDLKRVR